MLEREPPVRRDTVDLGADIRKGDAECPQGAVSQGSVTVELQIHEVVP